MAYEERDILVSPSERRIIEAFRKLKPGEKIQVSTDENGNAFLDDFDE